MAEEPLKDSGVHRFPLFIDAGLLAKQVPNGFKGISLCSFQRARDVSWLKHTYGDRNGESTLFLTDSLTG